MSIQATMGKNSKGAMMEKFKGNKSKYTFNELLDRYITQYLDPSGKQEDRIKWSKKKITYTNEGIWGDFTRLRDSFSVLLTRADGFVPSVLGNELAQRMIDAFLLKRVRGDDVTVPQQVVPINAAPDGAESMELIAAEKFSSDKTVSANEEIRWIFNNMQVAGLKPSDSPSSGAWSLLQELRNDDSQRRDFYKTMWPKLVTKEDTDRGGKLADSGKETIELIDKLIAALPEEAK